MLGRIGWYFGMLDIYSRSYKKSTRLSASLLTFYKAYFGFCIKCKDVLKEAHGNRTSWYKSSSIKLVAKSLWKPVKHEFESVIHKLEAALNSIKEEADLAEKEEAVNAREKVSEQALHHSHRSLFEWLNPVDPSINYEKASSLRKEGTGEWLFATFQFQEWQSTNGGILWLHAKPGAGKTIMASTLIRSLNSLVSHTDEMVLFYFCDYKEPRGQHSRTMIQTLIATACHQSREALEMMTDVSKRYTEYNSACSTSDLFDIFLRCLATRKRVVLVIDALDECNDRVDATRMLLEITRKLPYVSVLVTSREEEDIKKALRGVPHLRLEPRSMAQDIEVYVKKELRKLLVSGALKIREASLEGKIAEELNSKADGM